MSDTFVSLLETQIGNASQDWLNIYYNKKNYIFHIWLVWLVAKAIKNPADEEDNKSPIISEKAQQCLEKMNKGQWLGAYNLVKALQGLLLFIHLIFFFLNLIVCADVSIGRILSLICEIKLEGVEDFSQALNEIYAIRGQQGILFSFLNIPPSFSSHSHVII